MRLLALLVAGLLAGAVMAAPVPKVKQQEALYFPVQDGSKRVMQMKDWDTTSETIEMVTKVEVKDGVYRVSVTRDIGGRADVTPQVFEVSSKGVARLTSGGAETKTPYQLLKLGVKEGDTWTSELELLGGDVTKTTHTMGKEEEVEVPAGKFKAIRVVSESDGRGGFAKTTSWHAPGVGMVKTETDRGGRKSVRELKSFTLGKDSPKKADDKKDEPKKDK